MPLKKTQAVLLSAIISLAFGINAYAAAVLSATVTGDLLYVRRGPGSSYSRVKQLSKGDVVKVYEQQNGWDRIGTNQWVSKEYLKIGATAKSSKASASVSHPFDAKINASLLYVRRGPGSSYSRVKQLSKGDVVKVYEQQNGWDRIGTNQWVAGEFLKKTAIAVVYRITKSDPVSDPTPVAVADAAPANERAADLSASEVKTDLNANCLQAIKKANTFCLSIASGCHTWNSGTEKCQAANQECEDRQKAALDLCPQAN